jgi:Cd2+/Zn2+-exporting ATPase
MPIAAKRPAATYLTTFTGTLGESHPREGQPARREQHAERRAGDHRHEAVGASRAFSRESAFGLARTVTWRSAGGKPAKSHEQAEALEREGQTVVAIGNERHVCRLLAIAGANLGVAMGAAAAIETADIALMSDDLRKLPWLVRHPRRPGLCR